MIANVETKTAQFSADRRASRRHKFTASGGHRGESVTFLESRDGLAVTTAKAVKRPSEVVFAHRQFDRYFCSLSSVTRAVRLRY